MTDIEDLITKYNVDTRNNRLRDFYETDNLWRTLKIERDENRHSSFIAWLLNKDAMSDIQFDDGSKSAIKQVQSDACISSAEREQARPKVKSVRMPFRKMKRTTVMKNVNQNNGAKSLLDEVRGLVDSNLRMIHEAIIRNLYQQLGVEPRELYSVERYETTNAKGQSERGYLYNYNKQYGPIHSQIRARLDERGNLLDAIQTK